MWCFWHLPLFHQAWLVFTTALMVAIPLRVVLKGKVELMSSVAPCSVHYSVMLYTYSQGISLVVSAHTVPNYEGRSSSSPALQCGFLHKLRNLASCDAAIFLLSNSNLDLGQDGETRLVEWVFLCLVPVEACQEHCQNVHASMDGRPPLGM